LHPDEPGENGLDHSPRGRLAQGLGQERDGPRLVTVERLAEQLLLVPEGGVEAGSVDPHGPGQLRERGTLVPACPEHLQCPVQCLIQVELSRAPRRHGDLLRKTCRQPLTGNAVERTVTTLGRLDVLVNNAGTIIPMKVEETTLADFDRVFAVNVRGVFVATQAALKHLKTGGRIIMIGSCLGERVLWPGMAPYAATKGAVKMFTQGLARELGARGITV